MEALLAWDCMLSIVIGLTRDITSCFYVWDARKRTIVVIDTDVTRLSVDSFKD